MESYPFKELFRMFPNKQCLNIIESSIFDGDGVDCQALSQEIKVYSVITALERTNGNIAQASRILKMNRTTLTEFMRSNGIDRSFF